MKKNFLLTGFIFFSLFCSKRNYFKGIENPKDIFERSIEFYNKKKYNIAIEGFKKVIYSDEVIDITDDAQFYLAKCYYSIRDYDQAIMEFQFLVDHFPESEYKEEAEYWIGKIKFLQTPPPEIDQELTYETQRYMQNFLEKYPQSKFKEDAEFIIKKCREKLAQKIFNNMVLYLKMGKENSARIYFHLLEEEYSDLPIYNRAKKILEKSR